MKQINKRIKSAIIQGLIFNILITLIFVGIVFSYILPSFQDIQDKLEEVDISIQEGKRISKEGLNFKEFKALYLSNSSLQDSYIVSLLKSLDEDFFSQNLTNEDFATFEEFIIQKRQYLLEKKSSEEFQKINEKINTIIPSYSDRKGISGGISDYSFVNYIEALLFTFNLDTNDTIGIGSVIPVEGGGENKESNQNTTEASLFYIPLQLNLVGQKSDILDFMHFIENVGTISVEDGQVVTYTDSVLRKTLEGDTFSTRYNIYENQVADIEYINMKTYIDQSPQPSNKDLLTFVRETQSREKYEVEMRIRFYVTGLPDYKLEEFIDQTITDFDVLQKDIKKTISQNKEVQKVAKSGDVLFAIETIKSLSFTIDTLSDTVSNLKKTFLKDRTKIDTVYDSAQKINEQIRQISNLLEENKRIINTIK